VFKNEFGSTTSDPVQQNHAYFVHLQGEGTSKSAMLLVTVIGCHYLQVFGATWNGSEICVNPLCSLVSLLFVPRDPINGVAKVACVLIALDHAIQCLMDLYNSPEEQISKGPYFKDNGKLKYMRKMKEEVECLFKSCCQVCSLLLW